MIIVRYAADFIVGFEHLGHGRLFLEQERAMSRMTQLGHRP
jgi:hypothetical protein